MKRVMINVLIYSSIIAGVISDKWLGVEWAGNLSLFAVWILTIMCFVALSVDSKEMFKSKDKVYLTGVLSTACVVVLVAAGWIVTAVFFSVSFFLFVCKRIEYIKSIKGER